MKRPLAIAFALLFVVSSPARTGEPSPVDSTQPAETRSDGPLLVPVGDNPEQIIACWLQTSLQRVYPTSPAGQQRTLSVLTARNRHVSFQACLANRGPAALDVGCTVTGAAGCEVRVRRVGYVPQWHATTDTPIEELDGEGYVPGLVPDPLYPETTARVGPHENQSFWITITVPAEASPGVRDLAIRFVLPNGAAQAELHAKLDVRSLVVQPRRDFPVTHWWRPETIYEHYEIEPFGDQWWKLAEAYIRNLVAHGNNVIFVQQLFPRREFVRRPAQMVKISCPAPGQYEFDWSDVRRLVRLARDCGATQFEWSHLWIYWGVQHAMPVYTLKDGQAVPLWPSDTDGHGELYTNFLRQFLPSFHQFLQEENLLDCSYFHLSDEPATEHIPNYRRARQTLRELAPWMKVMDALSDVEYGRQALTDMPIPVVSAAQAYIDEKIPHWVYFCCARADLISIVSWIPRWPRSACPVGCSTACAPGVFCTGVTTAGRSSSRMPWSIRSPKARPACGRAFRTVIRSWFTPARTDLWIPSGGRCSRNRWKTTPCCRPPELIPTMRCWKISERTQNFPRPRRGSSSRPRVLAGRER